MNSFIWYWQVNHSLSNHDKVQEKQATPEPQNYHNKVFISDQFSGLCKLFLSLYYIHFEITGGPCYLIGSRWCNLFMNCTIFALNRIFFQANEQATLKTKQPIRFRGLFKITNQIAGKWKTKSIMWQILQLLFPKLQFFPPKNGWI